MLVRVGFLPERGHALSVTVPRDQLEADRVELL
jgi:hypothetical protein